MPTFSFMLKHYSLSSESLSWRMTAHKYLSCYSLEEVFLYPLINVVAVFFSEDAREM